MRIGSEATSAEAMNRRESQLQGLLRREAEDFLLAELIEAYPARRDRFWERDYGSIAAYRDSVASNREQWRDVLGRFPESSDDFDPTSTPILETEEAVVRRISIRPFDDELRARAILGHPPADDGPYPLVIAQHGFSSAPEHVFGFVDPEGSYRSYGAHLIEQGYAVLAPRHVTTGGPRNRLERIAQLMGASLFGLEVHNLARLLDYCGAEVPAVDLDRVAMWGLSMGGQYVLYAVPAEERIDLGICSAFFNRRLEKMVTEDPRFSPFIRPEKYEHVFLPGWLRAFSDADLTSLICPRPFLVQAGKADGIAWWPDVIDEYERAASHYEKLGLDNRIRLDLHEGGHEVNVTTGLAFLEEFL